MKTTRILTMLAFAAAASVAVPAGVDAQDPVPPVQEEPIEVTDELLERFVGVYPGVVSVAQAAQAELAAVETAEEAQAIQADAQERVVEILEEGEVTPAEYEAVVARLNDDPVLMEEFEEMLEEKQEGGSGR